MKILTAVTIFGFSGPVPAQSFAPKLKLLTCEALMKSADKYTTKQNVLPVLREAIYRLQKAVPSAGDNGTSFSNVWYSGSFDSLSVKRAQKIIQRLNGIENNLTSTNLDAQVLAFEIRGNDIQKALVEIGESEANLNRIYGQMISPKKRVAMWILNLIMLNAAYGNALDFGNMLLHFNHASWSALAAPAFFTLTYLSVYKDTLGYNRERLDWTYSDLKSFLARTQKPGDDQNELFVSASQIKLPVEFHKILINSDQASIQYGRQLAIEEYGSTYIWRTLSQLLSGQAFREMAREVRNAGDTNRNIFVDHIVYFDHETNEPVWLFFYRAFRDRPAGRKPSKKETRESQRDVELTPGLKPVPLIGR